MDKTLRQILALMQTLSARQRKALAAHLAALDKAPEAIGVIESRQHEQPVCPHCSKTRIVRNGHSAGLQRYLCRDCGKTFNALTATPLAHLHLRGKWLQQAQALRDGLSLSQVQDRLGIARTTALRWRHRFLAVPKQMRAHQLTGVAEADQTYFLRSAKGQRHECQHNRNGIEKAVNQNVVQIQHDKASAGYHGQAIPLCLIRVQLPCMGQSVQKSSPGRPFRGARGGIAVYLYIITEIYSCSPPEGVLLCWRYTDNRH